MEPRDPSRESPAAGPGLRIRGVDVYPPEDAEGSARRRAAGADIPPRSLVFVPSVGLGFGLAELLARLPEGCAVLCIEVDEQLMALAAARGLPADPRLAIVRTRDPAAAAALLTSLGPGRFRRLVEVPLCAGYRLAPPVYRSLKEVLEDGIRTWWRNRLTLIALGDRMLGNLLANLPMLPAASDAGELASDSPVVVAAAGPSLDACLPLLRSLRDRFLLVAADTALSSLAAHGIVPDLVVCLEAQHANLRDFLGPCLAAPSPLLVCELAGLPTAARLFEGRLAFFSTTFAPTALLERLSASGLRPRELPPLGSVGVAAVAIALGLGSGSVFLAGLDFSYPGGRTHARDTPPHRAAVCTGERLAPAEGACAASLLARGLVRRAGVSGTVLTDAVLASYRDRLAVLLEHDAYRHGAERVSSIAAGGLPLGAPTLTPEEARARIEAASPGGPLRSGHPRCSSSDVAAFLRAEDERLAAAEVVAGALLAAGSPSVATTEAQRATLAAVDYAWLAFPDEVDLARPSRSFLARARLALAGYRRHVRCSLARC